ncbi:bifunctional 4-hydroxy-2-oxoglutarate aldolase/2-dehydro-3-deoxy-phosphogluconate aldolase [Bacillus horti]|uniref:2-dehydro-3-deoxyphosphogluconate aldolase/(4S)-4-hydroxy-2-oxoglutarate aldolase n=1 Tax=Caldalkalibacillus horti TaxID=77523 RepID=A0ABT9W2Q4_9BACI|nr:bifunctional 4-hydroxy-2-oxoglutarate aldolase/2-dehydro-3-deoxy-phosphogluconate aldolase [Bacillus horti]MDQ0167519.1 2-dehydro-3-deoxyphosphogluconate aldolase/(4S)-4-hydroxy-2-oxoglutarate aldolase [Bacillus horti]
MLTREEKIQSLKDAQVVAVIRKIDPDKVIPLVSALVAGGVTGIEITLDSQNALKLIKESKERFGQEAFVGAGTVLSVEEAKEALEAGADFIVSPILNKEVVDHVKETSSLVVPGVYTPTEMWQAMQWGADMVKIFPITTLGPKFIKDVKGPLSHIPLMTTGGIDLSNIAEYVKAGVHAVGVGGSLMDKVLIQNNDWDGLTQLAKRFKEAVQG